jgi:hypothetical protein
VCSALLNVENPAVMPKKEKQLLCFKFAFCSSLGERFFLLLLFAEGCLNILGHLLVARHKS